eukprot:CAMPEP_0183318118 /NCGR_PEP_ID=MMETSP0160_2-20130417/59789_1 /TAXON_ID=2839 ORGANISM="Odontella Sinensis, Strain Grunow 1884" /NCGR_SAMPLE_ID=MMETSP0160_2 /ASSEMBLY_ACC=CAM_ASM_000250 /LENGTH=91 /DNA_ID=CAMNT_0025484293 /DNA_START=168 /DNA_END=440 /DNA_ORIENTATION=-
MAGPIVDTAEGKKRRKLFQKEKPKKIAPGEKWRWRWLSHFGVEVSRVENEGLAADGGQGYDKAWRWPVVDTAARSRSKRRRLATEDAKTNP